MESEKQIKLVSFCCPEHKAIDGVVEYFSVNIGRKTLVDVPVMYCEECRKFYTPFANILRLTKLKYKGCQVVATQGQPSKSFPKVAVRCPYIVSDEKCDDHEDRESKVQAIPSNIVNANRSQAKPQNKDNTLKGFNVISIPRAYRCGKISLVNYSCKECPDCHRGVLDRSCVLPIGENKGVEVFGKYCSWCTTTWVTRGHVLQRLIKNAPAYAVDNVMTSYLIPDYPKKREFVKTLKTASVAVHLKQKGIANHRMFVIVCSKSERNSSRDILHYTDQAARQLLFSLYTNNMRINIDGDEYDILRCDLADKNARSWPMYMSVNRIILRDGDGLSRGVSQSELELTDMLMYSPFTKCFEVVYASFDKKKRLYYMDARVFRNFLRRYGDPGIDVEAYGCERDSYCSVRNESFLHAYGYSVAQNSGLTRTERQALLSEVIDLGFMTQEDIANLLSYNINMRPGEQYRHARMCWEEDIAFIWSYDRKPDRFGTGKDRLSKRHDR